MVSWRFTGFFSSKNGCIEFCIVCIHPECISGFLSLTRHTFLREPFFLTILLCKKLFVLSEGQVQDAHSWTHKHVVGFVVFSVELFFDAIVLGWIKLFKIFLEYESILFCLHELKILHTVLNYFRFTKIQETFAHLHECFPTTFKPLKLINLWNSLII